MSYRLVPATLILTLFAAAGCSTAKVRVMPGENGLNRAVSRDIERDNAETAAVDAANEYCEKRKQSAVFVSTDKTKYTGDMDESTRNTVRKASGVASVLGGFGTPIGQAGQAGRMMTNDRDYESAVAFRCK
jgi:hypothetical protein